ncbi:MAG: ABC transporter substrate-binding protein [Proteobacteria bacterium]|nr:ABC transporter substrate-binding protein [Pseudomonadota bacterium]MBI3499734.1 ABC transporter substrate-binding protein [Pseudomonadota bacterium]
MKRILVVAIGALLIAASSFGQAQAQGQVSCPVKFGGVLPLTGSMGPVGKNIADSAQLAIDHVNQGGGVKGCPVQFILRDDQGQPTVGVDAAKYLVEVEHVPVLSGTVSSGVSLPILNAVAAPSKIPMISCCSTATTFTTLSQEGKTGGFFFRTFPTVKMQAYTTAKAAADRGYKKVTIIYVNTDFGTGLVKDFSAAFKKLGGEVTKAIPFNDNQPSYRPEVNLALAEKPDAAFFVAFPQDAATITREWLSLGGHQNIILINSARAPEYVKAVGAKFLQKAFGTDFAPANTPQVESFRKAYQAAFNRSADGPGLPNQYDAIVVMALAMNMAPDLSGPAIRDAVRKIQNASGTVVGTGPDEYKKAIQLIKEGKPIRYSGATGPLEFDANGDVSGLGLVWNIKGEELGIDHTFSAEEMAALIKQVDG